MRIEQETRNLYVGNLRQAEQKTPEEVAENLKNGRVFSGKVQFPQDKIAERRRAAQEKAMGIVKAAFAGERILDASVEEMQTSIEKGKDEMLAQKAELNRIAEEKEKLKGNNFLTSEEYEREMAELSKAESHFKGLIQDGKKYEDRTIQALTDIKIERAKSNPMVDAGKEAEAVLEAGGKEVIGMLFEEAKEHMETEFEKQQQAAEEKAAKEKELEERIEEMRAEKKEEDDTETPAVEQLERSTRRMVKIAETGESIQKELKNVVDRLKLDLEDLKGAAVDEVL
ncbi:MAG: hypothetical protein IJ006_01110 [Lachnospiraceae bacterium]|nr:hypothetical protein [Lachnospiraceae bacterium]MBQ8845720.1 hypothetical protein [Lachnospiraceae bacterium]